MAVHPNSLKNLALGQFKKGECPNPGGKPVGALNTLSNTFIKDFMAHYNEHGVDAINALCADKPDKYVELAAKLALSVIPKQIEHNVNPTVLDDLNREQLESLHRDLRTVIGLAGSGSDADSADGHKGELSPLH